MKRLAMLLFACVGMLGVLRAQQIDFYISPAGTAGNDGRSAQAPLQTLAQARDAVRPVLGTAPVVVHVMAGVYPLTEAVRFGPEDSGTSECPVSYRAQGRAEFCGGKRISGWKKHRDNIWVATLPQVAAGVWDFRQLYVNGEMRLRARTPNEGAFIVESQPGITLQTNYATRSAEFVYATGDVNPRWKAPTQGEAIVYHYWTDSHLPVASIDGTSRVMRFRYPSTKVFRDGFEQGMARYVIENIYETLDRPGEWVLDRGGGRLYYMPMPGENMQTTEIIAPCTGEFIRLQGNAAEGRFVEHLTFEGLGFRHSNFLLREGDANDTQAAGTVSACVNLSHVRNCSFEKCEFRNLATYAIELFAGCRTNRFCRNTVEQVCAGGFRIRGSGPGASPALRTSGNTICDNTIAYYGRYYSSAVGILLMHTDDNDISHNLIHHGDYTGISVGWSWNYLRSAAINNRIEYNHIHHIGMNNLLSDMGGIYTLGFSPGTVLRGNLIHDVQANQYGGWGIYTDEGSTAVLIENNVVYRTKFGMFNIHYARDLTVRNNIFALGRLEQLSRDRIEPHVSVYFEGNIIYWREGKLLAKEWGDKPYKVYFNYFRQMEDATTTVVSDWNLFYNPTLTIDQVDFNGRDWAAWREMGRDKHSLYADPLFMDPDKGDFRLKYDSPALKMGFTQIDVSKAGPRPE